MASEGRTAPPALVRAMELVGEDRDAGRSGDGEHLRAAPDPVDAPPRRSVGARVVARTLRPALRAALQRPRILTYRLLSSCPRVSGHPIVLQPVLFEGAGRIALGAGVQFGWPTSPLFYTGYSLVEASLPHASVEVGDRTEFNNNLFVKSEGAGIRIGRDGLFGAHVEVLDSDFHPLEPARRRHGAAATAPVVIADGVFVGMGARILKGVSIGADSVIGAGSVVTGPIPSGVIAAGNPARVIREL